MSFEQLLHATRIQSNDTLYFDLVEDWRAKRDKVLLCTNALPLIASAMKQRTKKPYEHNPRISVEDQLPRLNLEFVCESSVGTFYAMSEIAARFGNRVSGGKMPASFNDIRQSVEQGTADPALTSALGDLQWYRKVREIRTEWTHFSNMFIGEDASGEPLLIAEAKRKACDKQECPARVHFGLPDLILWLCRATATIDAFGDHVLRAHVLLKFDPATTFTHAQCDVNGVPIVKTDGRLEVETINHRRVSAKGGIAVAMQRARPLCIAC